MAALKPLDIVELVIYKVSNDDERKMLTDAMDDDPKET